MLPLPSSSFKVNVACAGALPQSSNDAAAKVSICFFIYFFLRICFRPVCCHFENAAQKHSFPKSAALKMRSNYGHIIKQTIGPDNQGNKLNLR